MKNMRNIQAGIYAKLSLEVRLSFSCHCEEQRDEAIQNCHVKRSETAVPFGL